MRIDVQHHAMPEKIFRKFHDPALPPKRYLINGNDFVFNPYLCNLDYHIKCMDECGMDIALLSISQFANLMGKELCRETNEAFAEEVERYKGRFLVAGCIPQDDPAAAIEEMEYQVKELKFPGITLLTSLNSDINLSNKEFMFPIYEKAVELDIPIFLHPHLRPYGVDETDCTINRSLGRGVDAARSLLRLIYDVLPNFPDAKFVLPHFAGASLAMKGRMKAFYEPDPALGLPEPRPQFKNVAKTPLESIELGHGAEFDKWFDKLYIDGAGSGGWPGITKMAFDNVRHDRLLWATDFPYEIHEGRDFNYYIDSLTELGIPEESQKMFLGDNAARLLKLI